MNYSTSRSFPAIPKMFLGILEMPKINMSYTTNHPKTTFIKSWPIPKDSMPGSEIWNCKSLMTLKQYGMMIRTKFSRESTDTFAIASIKNAPYPMYSSAGWRVQKRNFHISGISIAFFRDWKNLISLIISKKYKGDQYSVFIH